MLKGRDQYVTINICVGARIFLYIQKGQAGACPYLNSQGAQYVTINHLCGRKDFLAHTEGAFTFDAFAASAAAFAAAAALSWAV
jgi:hypothetical protein